MMDKNYYKILRSITGTTYHLPIYLDSKGYEMGGMVGFEGDIEQVEQITNFNYQHTSGNTIRLYNSVNKANFYHSKHAKLFNSVLTSYVQSFIPIFGVLDELGGVLSIRGSFNLCVKIRSNFCLFSV